MLGPGIGESGVLEALCGDAQVQGSLLALSHVGCELAHHLDEPLLDCRRLGEAAVGGAAHAVVHERGYHRVVAGQAEPFEVIECLRNAVGGGRPETSISMSVEMPSSGSAAISVSTTATSASR